MDSTKTAYQSKFHELACNLENLNKSGNHYLTEKLKCIADVCQLLECVLLDGLNPNIGMSENGKEFTFWCVVDHYISINDRQVLLNLGHIRTESGLCRAFLRYCLNENCLFSYIDQIVGNDSMLKKQYSNSAFLNKVENRKTLLNFIKVLEKFEFGLEIDNRELNSCFDFPDESPKYPNTRRRSSTLDEGKLSLSIEKKVPSTTKTEISELRQGNQNFLRAISNPGGMKRYSLGRIDKLKCDSYSSQDSVCSLDTNCEETEVKSNSQTAEQNSDGNLMVSLTGEDHSLFFRWTGDRKGYVDQSNSEDSEDEDDLQDASSTAQDNNSMLFHKPNSYLSKRLGDFDNEELKETLITKIDERDRLSAENKKLTRQVEELQSHVKTSEEKQKQTILKLEQSAHSDHIIITGLRRETELLKHQLKKYIVTVQELQARDCSAGQTKEDLVSKEPHLRSEIDHYEQRLVELTELHADLLAVNDRLQRDLISKDLQLKQFQTQIEEITGPLADCKFQCAVIRSQPNSPAQPIKPTFILQTGFVPPIPESETCREHVSVNLWIPCAFLKGSGKQSHHLYQIYVHVGKDEWNVYRRYSDFHSLHTFLKQHTTWADNLDFPNKRVLGRRSDTVVEDRRKRLESYLRHAVKFIVGDKENKQAETSAKKIFCSWMPFLSDGSLSLNKPSGSSSLYYGL